MTRPLLLAGALSFAAFASPTATAQSRLASTIDLPRAEGEGRSCGTLTLPDSERRAIQDKIRPYLQGAAAARAVDELLIPVAYHIITSTSGAGDVPEQWIRDQHEVMNASFAPWGIQFDSVLVQRVANDAWYSDFEANDGAAKTALAVDPATTLNMYFAPLPDLLGYAYLPGQWPEGDPRWGVVNRTTSMPGSGAAPYDLGDTAVHEAGHALGLDHTFAGGCHADSVCDSAGDFVCDTPSEARPYFGACDTTRDTCPSPGNDPVRNFMDYSDDICMDTFTQGQSDRMRAMLQAFLPTLYENAVQETVPAELALSATELAFGEVLVGETTTLPITISNPSDFAVQIVSVTTPEGFSTPFSGGISLNSGGVFNTFVAFSPDASGPFSGDLVIATDVDGGTDYTVALSGIGGAPPFSLTGSLDYGTCPEPPNALPEGNGRCFVDASGTNGLPVGQRYTIFLRLDGPEGFSRIAFRGEIKPRAGETIARPLALRTFASDPLGPYTLVMLAETGSAAVPGVGAVELASLELEKGTRPMLRLEAPLSVSPNPVAGRATFRFATADEAEATLVVYDAIGREVARPVEGAVLGAVEAAFDTAALPAGLYVARLTMGERVETVRLSVLH